MPDRVLAISIQLQLFALRQACEKYAQLSRSDGVSGAETLAALNQIQDIRNTLDPLPANTQGADLLKRHFENSTLGTALAAGDDALFASIWDSFVFWVRTTTPESPRRPSLMLALHSLEGPSIELIECFPPSAQARDLGKEFAALAPQGGSVYLGVNDAGEVVGLDFQSRAALDKFELRVRGIAKATDPSVELKAHWLTVGDKVLLEAEIAPSGEPFHIFEKIPYIRDGSSSRAASQSELVRAVRRGFESSTELSTADFLDELRLLFDEIERNLHLAGRARSHPDRRHLDKAIELGEHLHIAPNDYGLMSALYELVKVIDVQQDFRDYPSQTRNQHFEANFTGQANSTCEFIQMFRHRWPVDHPNLH